MKGFGIFALGFVAGFATLFVLVLIFGDYKEPVQTQPVVAIGPSPTATRVIVATTVPTATPIPATSTPEPTSTPKPTATPAPIPTATLAPVAMHQDLTMDGIRWRAIAVQEIGSVLASDNEWTDDATTDGKFVRVTMNVENRRNEPESGYFAPDLVDVQGRRFRAFEERFYYLPDTESCSMETFNPNLTRTCTEIYAIAADSAGLYKLIVNNFEMFDSLEATIELR